MSQPSKNNKVVLILRDMLATYRQITYMTATVGPTLGHCQPTLLKYATIFNEIQVQLLYVYILCGYISEMLAIQRQITGMSAAAGPTSARYTIFVAAICPP